MNQEEVEWYIRNQLDLNQQNVDISQVEISIDELMKSVYIGHCTNMETFNYDISTNTNVLEDISNNNLAIDTDGDGINDDIKTKDYDGNGDIDNDDEVKRKYYKAHALIGRHLGEWIKNSGNKLNDGKLTFNELCEILQCNN